MPLGPVPWVAGGGPPCAVENGPLDGARGGHAEEGVGVLADEVDVAVGAGRRCPGGSRRPRGTGRAVPPGVTRVTALAGVGRALPPSVGQMLPATSAIWVGPLGRPRRRSGRRRPPGGSWLTEFAPGSANQMLPFGPAMIPSGCETPSGLPVSKLVTGGGGRRPGDGGRDAEGPAGGDHLTAETIHTLHGSSPRSVGWDGVVPPPVAIQAGRAGREARPAGDQSAARGGAVPRSSFV